METKTVRVDVRIEPSLKRDAGIAARGLAHSLSEWIRNLIVRELKIIGRKHEK